MNARDELARKITGGVSAFDAVDELLHDPALVMRAMIEAGKVREEQSLRGEPCYVVSEDA